MLDAAEIERATGWRVLHLPSADSTNDEAGRLRDAGGGPRVVVVADEQHRGRGRAGHVFSSPRGGLYASLLVAVAPDDLPGPLGAAIALATAEAIDEVAEVHTGIKWPNDLFVAERKVGGILLSASGPEVCVVVGIGVNVAAVPTDLPSEVRARTTALGEAARRAVTRSALLGALLPHVDERTADLGFPARREALARAWHDRLVHLGRRVEFELRGRRRRGVLVDASLEEGLVLDDDTEGRIRPRGEHVREIRLLD